MRAKIIAAALAIAGTLSVAPFERAFADPPGVVIGKVSQPIVVGDPVSTKRQRELGLVTINNNGGTCSGTLLNRYWVLTADHCVTTNATVGGTAQAFANMSVTAAWTGKPARPTRFVRYSGRGLDVALIFLGRSDLGKVDRRLIYHNEVDTSMTLAKFGQGICAYATAGPPAQPAQSNCGYRTALFTPSSAGATSIVLPANDAGQVGNGGDSGGPDYVTGEGGVVISIASVQSTCSRTGSVMGKPANWTWTTGIESCTSAALSTIRDDINLAIKETPTFDIVTNVPGGDFSDVVTKRDTGIVTQRPGTDVSDVVAKPDVDIVTNRPNDRVSALSVNCKSGYVWRVIKPDDLVCVEPPARTLAAQENADGPGHVDPDGAYGPSSCESGYVWRNAFAGDLVCVTPPARDRVAGENQLGASRIVGH